MSGPMAALLRIRFTGWWLGGTGKSGGSTIDMVAYRDRNGCPALPMTQVKGVLRQTATDFGLLNAVDLPHFFGRASDPALDAKTDSEGAIRFAGDATLPSAELAFFSAASNVDARAALFSVLRSTAINAATGTALDDSLRSMEVVAPIMIERRLQWIGRTPPPADWVVKLDAVCAFTPAFGKARNDGMGRAIATVEALA